MIKLYNVIEVLIIVCTTVKYSEFQLINCSLIIHSGGSMQNLFLFNFIVRRMTFLILTIFFSFAFVYQVEAQNVDNKGNEFIMSYLTPYSSGATQQLHLTSDVNTAVTIQYPVNSPTFETTVNVSPGTIEIVEIPSDAANGWIPGTVQNNSVRAFSAPNTEFVCYMTNIETFTSDAALALPVDTYNTEFIALTYNPLFTGSMFTVTAAFNNTTVTIIPSKNLQGGFAAGVPFNITLNKGEGFQGRGNSSGIDGDVSGSIIQSDKPVTLVNGNQCTNVPPFQLYCDHIFEIAQPTQSWGNRVLIQGLINNPEGPVYRIIASEDNTSISIDGALLTNLNRGQFYETDRLPGNHEFTSDKPIFVSQFMTGMNPGFGDPAMCNMIPPEQFQNAYVFSTVGGLQYAEHYINLIAQNDNIGSVLLDGSPIPAGDFTAIGSTGYSAATVSIGEGTHATSSPDGHGLVVYGVNEDDSYLYPGGALFNFINPGTDLNPPICEVTILGNFANGSATDNGTDDTGIFFVVLDAGSDNLNLAVAPFTPGDPVVTYTVNLIDPNQNGSGTVLATDGSGNQCNSEISLQGGGGVFDYMTLWAVSDANSGKLYYYSLVENASAFLNIEGDILGIQGDKDIEDMKINDNGEFYFVNNVGTSTIYKFNFSDLDGDGTTPVPAVLVGSTGLPSDPNTDSPEEIASLLFYEIPTDRIIFSNLYGIGKASKKLYNISTIDGSIVEIATLNVNGDFRTDGMTIGADGIVYLLKTNDTGGESEIWKFNEFPSGDISYVRQIETSLKVEALSAHPNGYLYASDMYRFFEISVNDSYIGYLADYNVDVEGMDFFYQLEQYLPIQPVLQFTPIQGATDVKNTSKIPTEFGLTQNYPNPFNPSTTINYSIPQAGFVNISVYNLLGENVATLVNENLQVGTYAIQFNADNLPSGMYIYKLVTNGFSQSMKMMLTK